jgi:hypothetical protein
MVPVIKLQVGCVTVTVGAAGIALTVIVMVAVEAHCPAAGVNVYVVVALLFKAGAQLPLMPSTEVVGNADSVAPAHTGATGANVGITAGLTAMVSVVFAAHCPTVGVKI